MSEPRPGWIILKHQATEQEFILEGASQTPVRRANT